jgi:hypothetical protein
VLHVSWQYDNGIKPRVIKAFGYLQNDDVRAVKIIAGMHKDDWDRPWIVNCWLSLWSHKCPMDVTFGRSLPLGRLGASVPLLSKWSLSFRRT